MISLVKRGATKATASGKSGPLRGTPDDMDLGTRLVLSKLLWSRLDKDGIDGCWKWSGPTTYDGYGQITVYRKGGGATTTVRAHRLSYLLTHPGDIPDGLVVRHKCDVPACCNPRHLELGTVMENNLDMYSRGRARSGFQYRLKPEMVSSIRAMFERGDDLRSIADKFGISQRTAYRCATSVTHRHVRSDDTTSNGNR